MLAEGAFGDERGACVDAYVPPARMMHRAAALVHATCVCVAALHELAQRMRCALRPVDGCEYVQGTCIDAVYCFVPHSASYH